MAAATPRHLVEDLCGVTKATLYAEESMAPLRQIVIVVFEALSRYA